MIPKKPSRQVQSAITTFEVVETIQKLGTTTSSELTSQLDISKSAVHNYLSTLEREGYVVKEDGNYRLGLRLLTHGIAAEAAVSVSPSVDQELESIVADIGQPIWYIIEEGGRGIFLKSALPPETEPIHGRKGKRSYLHSHAPGKAILAETSDQMVSRVIEKHGLTPLTKKTTTNEEIFFDELDEIREQGFAISDGESVLGIQSVGTSFSDNSGRVYGLGAFGHSKDFTGTRIEGIASRLHEASNQLGTAPPDITYKL